MLPASIIFYNNYRVLLSLLNAESESKTFKTPNENPELSLYIWFISQKIIGEWYAYNDYGLLLSLIECYNRKQNFFKPPMCSDSWIGNFDLCCKKSLVSDVFTTTTDHCCPLTNVKSESNNFKLRSKKLNWYY